jgi:glycosyltransferase involved in cell wall biosynthesis
MSWQMRRLKVLLLPSIPYGPFDPTSKPADGPDRQAAARALAELGIEMRCIDPYRFPLNPLAGKHPLLQSLDPVRVLHALLIGNRYDVVISGNEGAAVLLVRLRRLFRLKVPVLAWDLSPEETWRGRAWLQDVTIPKIDGILAIPSIQEPYVRQRWGSQVRVCVLGQYIDTDFYRPQTVPPGNYILSVGDDGGRDFGTLLAAARDLDIDLRIKTSQRLPLDPAARARIQLLSERLAPMAFRALYAACDFVVVPLLPHPRNASGVSTVLEAGAMGKAAIVSDSDGIRDFIIPGETCLMVPAGDAQALASAIEQLRREPETRRRLGENARRFIEEQFAPAPFARRMAVALRRFVPDERSSR